MNYPFPPPQHPTRREVLNTAGMGSVALGALLAEMELTASSHAATAGIGNPLAPKHSYFPGTAKRVIHLFMIGGPSQIETFNPKPELKKFGGKKLDTSCMLSGP